MSADGTSGWVVLTHGGAASPAKLSDGCETAAQAARAVLVAGGGAMAAALEATRVLEDDERFNAGTGSNLRLDGTTAQMDAAVMTSAARPPLSRTPSFGAVGCIERVRNPILVAARVMDTPHVMLVGDGATAFARQLGFADFDPVTQRARDKHARAMAELAGQGDGGFADDARPWGDGAVQRYWNFASTPTSASTSAGTSTSTSRSTPGDCDTVGAVVRDQAGEFCATASTGGTVYMLRGRVGDSPLIGCGLYAGPLGAVACTGVGEEIARRMLAKTVYDWLAAGVAPREAGARAVAMFDAATDVGLLIASGHDHAIASNRDMASTALWG